MKKLLLFLSLSILTIGCSRDEPIGLEGNVVTPQISNTINQGRIAWYPFNGNANDESGNGNNGVVNGAELTFNKTGKPNSAFKFSNVTRFDQRIDVNLNTSSVTTSLSIAWWVKRNGNGYSSPRVFEFWPGSESDGKFASNIRNNESTMLFEHNISGTNIKFSLPYSINNDWTHYVYTIGNSVAKFYINGKLEYTQAVNTTSIKLGTNVAFGRMNHPSYDAFNGVVDDIAIYNRVISQDEINYYYNNQN
mgnify:CR=1 FL=1